MKALEDNKNSEPGGVKAHFRMDENGLLLLESVRQHTLYIDCVVVAIVVVVVVIVAVVVVVIIVVVVDRFNLISNMK